MYSKVSVFYVERGDLILLMYSHKNQLIRQIDEFSTLSVCRILHRLEIAARHFEFADFANEGSA